MVLFASVILSAFLINPSNVPGDSLKKKPAPAALMKIVEQVTQQPFKSNGNEIELEIDGLLVDDTKTKAGKDFYDLFYSSWEAPPEAKNYTITVSEKPFRLSNTIIAVSINENLVYQAILQPRQDILEAMTSQAISTTQEYLVNYQEIMRQINGDDMSGSGIY
ncbi:curli production assembly/transport component CsgE [Bacteroides luti]|uniref:Curli production assembly/transport component CsgE n=1 Tax=Bacteroides luti TaxID=1297750 RepID=A0A1M4Y3Q7_9BACE|nr:CsgE family curli-type amyloid fiber assembly protein [Bacteroides luti]SHF00226.1 curli production assembly/transport component CsgE [Bacteroides luti]